jgi:hypothetical protein
VWSTADVAGVGKNHEAMKPPAGDVDEIAHIHVGCRYTIQVPTIYYITEDNPMMPFCVYGTAILTVGA